MKWAWGGGTTRRMLTMGLVVTTFVVLDCGTSQACVGTACLEIYSTEDGGGALTVSWDFTKKVQTYQSFCAPDNSQCLYSTIDQGFMAPTVDDDPSDAYYLLDDNTAVSIVIIHADAPLSLNVNGQKLHQPGETALLGVMPTIHVHPSWQVVVPGDQFGDYNLSFKLTTDAPLYSESQVFSVVVTNVPPPTPNVTPTPTPTPEPPAACAGDCNGDGAVTVNEVILCVNMALGSATALACPACDVNADGTITVNEIIAAVNAALSGCPMPAPATLQDIQDTIFTPSCALSGCHDKASAVANLVLANGSAYSQLVGVSPSTLAAANAGLLRVDPGTPDNSFLLIKVTGPPPDEGSRMPLTGDLLTGDQIQLIRNWILQGAQP